MKKYYLLLVVLMGFGSVSGQIVNIPDALFKAKLLSASHSNDIAKDLSSNPFKIDANNDGEIQETEALNVSYLDLNGTNNNTLDITNLTGINSFLNLKYLFCSSNSINSIAISNLADLQFLLISNGTLTSLVLENLPSLTTLSCNSNNLNSLDVSNLPALITINAGSNLELNSFIATNSNNLEDITLTFCGFTNLDVSYLPNLKVLNCVNNNINNLNINNLSNLTGVSCANNQLTNFNFVGLNSIESITCASNLITNLDLSPYASTLQFLNCGDNLLTELSVNNISLLTGLVCSYNQIETLDVSNLNLTTLLCVSNNISYLSLKNGVNYNLSNSEYMGTYSLKPNPFLYICADENKIASLQDYFAFILPDLEINSYCNFVPGGAFYTIEGTTKFDGNANDCDDLDINYPFLKLNQTVSNNLVGSYVANSSGEYSIPVQAGTHTITPVLENPTYFNISPATATVTFPAAESPSTQNFCITPNGFHQDLDVTIVPMNPAVPGFDAHYKIIYRNIGNVNIAMGTVALDYDYSTLAYVSSSPVTEILPLGNLFWTFLNLQPFETRTIDVTFNLNSPTETPALIGGSLLTFQGYVETSVDEDTNPVDNVITLQQTVVNSFDPNDKTCLEGTQITPDMIGRYVHYMIRFENTGTFPAQNIVVKDMIDATKFDVASLVPLSASHDYITRITGNKVEFIFEGINLPFEDATNDGYIVFKIKTLPTLVLGDSFSNSASIYFDYNFPIVTEPAVTTFAVLGTQDFVFNNYLTVYPNPANDVLNITAKQSIELKSMEVYNMLGQLVLSVPKANGVASVDVSNLTTGTYFLKVISDKGTSNVKFVKK